jgi:hypothetical protein
VKRKTKEKANLIQLTFSALNKSGLVFACFLLGGLIFAGVSFWRTLQEDRPKSDSNIVEEVEPSLPLGHLSEQKTMTESSFDTYRNIAYKGTKNFFYFQLIFEKYAADFAITKMDGFQRDFGERLEAMSLRELEYVAGGNIEEFQRRKNEAIKEGMKQMQKQNKLIGKSASEIKKIKLRKDPLDFLETASSADELRKQLDLNEYQKDYNRIRKKDHYFEYGFEARH